MSFVEAVRLRVQCPLKAVILICFNCTLASIVFAPIPRKREAEQRSARQPLEWHISDDCVHPFAQ
jgi:hypothetical protein